jgi:ABC-type amino acid transport substrate-binding protein
VVPSASAATDDPSAGWDVLVTAATSSADGRVDFSPAYLQNLNAYLVAENLPIRSAMDVDRSEVRIAVVRGSPADRVLSGIVNRGEVVRADSQTAAAELLKTGQADVLAGGQGTLIPIAQQPSGSQMLDAGFATQYRMAVGTDRSELLA